MAEQKEKIEFKSQVLEKKAVSISIEVEIESSAVEGEIEKLLISTQKRVKIPGFRQGKAPRDIIKDSYFEAAKNDAVENLVKQTVFAAMERENFNPLDIPIVDEIDYKTGENLKYRFTAECSPSFEVKDYKEIPVQKEIFKITDEKILKALDALRQRNSIVAPSKTGIVGEKSIVYANYDVFDEKGEKIKELSVKEFAIDLSLDRTLKEFKDGLFGAKENDEREIKAHYESNYPNKLFAGKEVVFKIKINSIKEKEAPELNDDFAKDLDCENLEDLKKKVKENLERGEKERQQEAVYRIIDDYLLEKNVFEVPQCLIKEQEKTVIERLKSRLYGYSRDYIDNEIKSAQEIIKKDAENSVRLSYIINKIYTAENMQVSEEEIEKERAKILEGNPKNGAEYFEKNKDSIKSYLKENKIFDFLIANAKITEIVKD
ncbi:MAG: trigger factor [Elusimicrobiota bacterium]|jgi:trigger factor|nr:trigger factor [Elusimicrobiota bacterium]